MQWCKEVNGGRRLADQGRLMVEEEVEWGVNGIEQHKF